MITMAAERQQPLRAPFPWFGGKARAADMIWKAFGNVPNYVEPFAGSLAVLLARPHEAKVETANDKDGLIANFWRAIKLAPDQVAKHADWPVNEADLHARHRWLVQQAPGLYDKLLDDPDYFDPKIAGWWVWGVSTWIGNGWCHQDIRVSLQARRPNLNNAHGNGVHVIGLGSTTLHKSLPNITIPGNGVHAPTLHKKMPRNARGGSGVHPTLSEGKKPKTGRPTGVQARSDVLAETFAAIAARLRDVRICCGDWKRVLGRSTLGIDTRHGMTPTGILLDPPYAHELRDKRLYREDERGCSHEVREWAIEHGEHPDLRIALCGFEGEHKMPDSWLEVAWRAGSTSATSRKERIWFSPHCLSLDGQRQGELFV